MSVPGVGGGGESEITHAAAVAPAEWSYLMVVMICASGFGRAGSGWGPLSSGFLSHREGRRACGMGGMRSAQHPCALRAGHVDRAVPQGAHKMCPCAAGTWRTRHRPGRHFQPLAAVQRSSDQNSGQENPFLYVLTFSHFRLQFQILLLES